MQTECETKMDLVTNASVYNDLPYLLTLAPNDPVSERQPVARTSCVTLHVVDDFGPLVQDFLETCGDSVETTWPSVLARSTYMVEMCKDLDEGEAGCFYQLVFALLTEVGLNGTVAEDGTQLFYSEYCDVGDACALRIENATTVGEPRESACVLESYASQCATYVGQYCDPLARDLINGGSYEFYCTTACNESYVDVLRNSQCSTTTEESVDCFLDGQLACPVDTSVNFEDGGDLCYFDRQLASSIQSDILDDCEIDLVAGSAVCSDLCKSTLRTYISQNKCCFTSIMRSSTTGECNPTLNQSAPLELLQNACEARREEEPDFTYSTIPEPCSVYTAVIVPTLVATVAATVCPCGWF